MKWYEWVFEGIGTELVALVIGAIVGGITGYKICIRKNGIQKQKAGYGADQHQELEIEDSNSEGSGMNGNLRQIQQGGDVAKQRQIGTIKK